jgi:hypothetical protein
LLRAADLTLYVPVGQRLAGVIAGHDVPEQFPKVATRQPKKRGLPAA